MAEPTLNGAGIVPFLSERIAAGVPEHVWMSLERQTRFSASPLNHACEACGTEGSPTLGREDEWRPGLLLAL